jgi:hypothetical protein
MVVDLDKHELEALQFFMEVPFYLGDFEEVRGSKVWRAQIIWTEDTGVLIKQRIASAYAKLALADLSSPKTTMQAKDPLVCAVEILHHKFDNKSDKPRKRRQ